MIDTKKIEEDIQAKLSKRLSQKIKRNEQQLLCKSQEDFRLKKEIKDAIDDKKTDYERYGHKAWYK